jgi:hypothetical protein
MKVDRHISPKDHARALAAAGHEGANKVPLPQDYDGPEPTGLSPGDEVDDKVAEALGLKADGDTDKPLDQLSDPELQAKARDEGIDGYESMDRARLIEALKAKNSR